jgi:hypothetical protein
MEIDGGDNPKFKLIRLSRGDVANPKENEITDVVEVKRYNEKPEVPTCISPIEKSKVDIDEVILKASPFKISDNSEHGETHWQVARTDNFTHPDVDIWKNYEDWYGGKNLNEGIDLTRQQITSLQKNTTYHWRVRYRTKGLQWSDWSRVETFITK